MIESKQSVKPLTLKEQMEIWESLKKEDEETEELSLIENQKAFDKIISECKESEISENPNEK